MMKYSRFELIITNMIAIGWIFTLFWATIFKITFNFYFGLLTAFGCLSSMFLLSIPLYKLMKEYNEVLKDRKLKMKILERAKWENQNL